MKKFVGTLLMVLGLVGLSFGGLTYVSHRLAMEFGPVRMDVRERNTVPIPPLAGAAALAAGIFLVTSPKHRYGG